MNKTQKRKKKTIHHDYNFLNKRIDCFHINNIKQQQNSKPENTKKKKISSTPALK